MGEAESKLLARLRAAEAILFDPDDERCPQGELWYARLARFRGWLGQLRDLRREAVDRGEQAAGCPRCGSPAFIDGPLHGCMDCHPVTGEGRLAELLAGQGYAAVEMPLGGEVDVMVVVRETDTEVQGRFRGAPRITISELMQYAGLDREAREGMMAIKSIFRGAHPVSGASGAGSTELSSRESVSV